MKKVVSNFIDFKKISPLIVLFFMGIVMTSLISCKKDKVDPDEIFKGPEVNMGNGKANSFFKTNGSGAPLEIGFEMTMEALTGLNQDPTTPGLSTFVLPLNQKAIDLTPFDHLVINWQPQGHPPTGVYTLPHFDFHLYKITLAERMAIPPYSPATAAKMDLLPPAGFMPASYNADPGGIPAMGKHWGNPALVTNPFNHTMIYGSYNGEVHFIEPMVTLAVLQAGSTISIPYAQPEKFAKAGKWYPTKYTIYQDQQTKKYYVTLIDFVKR
jgi:hypothetical protein